MEEKSAIDILLIVFVMGTQAENLISSLREKNFQFTQVDSRGGFLLEKMTCLFIGLSRTRFAEALELIRITCPRRLQYVPARMEIPAALQGQPVVMEAEVGGANIIALEVERFIRLE